MPLVLLATTALMAFSCDSKNEPQDVKREIYPVHMTLNPPVSMRWEVTKNVFAGFIQPPLSEDIFVIEK